MAFRYLIYSTGTTYSGTILRESATNNPGVGEASLYSEFVIPEIQPLYLWQVSGGNVIPNTETKIGLYETAVAPPPTSEDVISYGEVTGITSTKIDKVPGFTGKIPTFTAGGNLQNSGYTPAELIASGSGVTTTTFAYYTGTTAPATFANKAIFNLYTGTTAPNTYYNKTQINSYTGATNILIGTKLNTSVFSTFTGTTLPANYYNKTQINLYTGATNTLIGTKLNTSVFSTYTGTTVPNTYYNKTQINSYTGQTATLIGTKVSKVTGATTNNIVTFAVAGAVQDSGKDFITIVNTVGVATNAHIPTELAVRNAINQAVSAAVILQGDWNATTNSPSLTGPLSAYTTGYAWRVSVSGTTSLSGINKWYVGDMAIKGATGWMRTASEDIAAIWGNISGTLSNQSDLQNALNLKLDRSIFGTYTGTTAPNQFASRSFLSTYTGTTAPNTFASKSFLSNYTGTTVPNTYQTIANVSHFTGTTLPANYYNKTQINAFTGTTLPANYYNKTQINSYTAQTQTQINSKLNTSVFTGYTASTKNKDKKIQVVSTSTANANVVSPFGIVWNSASPYANDMYLWSGGSAVWIKSAGTYEIQYHILLKNDNANQTHSVGAYVIKNNSTTLVNTAGAGMVVGSNASGEISLPPVVQTLALNDRLDLAVFRVGSAGNANLVASSVFMTLNKLT